MNAEGEYLRILLYMVLATSLKKPMFVTTASCCKRRYTMNPEEYLDGAVRNSGLVRTQHGFWVSMAAVTLTMVVMNAAFLGMKPRKKVTEEIKNA